MQSAATYLNVVRDRGRRGLPLEDVDRQLFNPALSVLAYGKIAANAGALTPGITEETADGMSLAKIERIIGLLRQEKYRWTPVRRVQIPKRNGNTRPLGIPTWSDRLPRTHPRQPLPAVGREPLEGGVPGGVDVPPHPQRLAARGRGQPHPREHLP